MTRDELEEKLDEIQNQFFFKGNALAPCVAKALDVVEDLNIDIRYWQSSTQSLSNQAKTLKGKKAELKEQLNTARDDIKYYKELIIEKDERIEKQNKKIESLKSAIKTGRQNTVARANRYKAKYEQLLDAIDSVLPGAKDMLTGKVLTPEAKAQKLEQLNKRIDFHFKKAENLEDYNYRKRKTIYRPGYGLQCKILKDLRAKKKALEAS